MFILVREADWEKVHREFKRIDGKVCRTLLAHVDQTRLQKTLDEPSRDTRFWRQGTTSWRDLG